MQYEVHTNEPNILYLCTIFLFRTVGFMQGDCKAVPCNMGALRDRLSSGDLFFGNHKILGAKVVLISTVKI